MHFRHKLAVPIVIRAPSAGGFSGGPFHSQNLESWFLSTPGLKVCVPATAEDAGLLLAAAIRDPNPVMFFEQKSLYTRVKGAFVQDDTADLAGAAIVRPGADVTLVSYGASLHLCLAAADRLTDDDVDVEVIDLRVLCPLDWETVAESVQRTSRLAIVHEAYAEFGVASEVASRAAVELFQHLDAPVQRLGAAFHPIPFSPPLEQATLPGVEDIVRSVNQLAAF